MLHNIHGLIEEAFVNGKSYVNYASESTSKYVELAVVCFKEVPLH
jgi:hypothetical protein